jgi:hypothetical protein
MEQGPTRPRDPFAGGPRPGDGGGERYDEPLGPEWDYQTTPPPRSRMDFRPLFALLEGLRRALPRDLQDQFTTLIREALLTLRALIDWYLERLDRPPREPKVEDIPID